LLTDGSEKTKGMEMLTVKKGDVAGINRNTIQKDFKMKKI